MTLGSIGQLGEQAAVRRLQIDDVTCTFIVDGAMSMAPGVFLKTIPSTYWDEHPEELDPYGQVAMSAGGLLIERGNHRLLIDAGLGNRKEQNDFGRIDCGAFLDVLQHIGLRREDIDVFALTHMHADHTGWAFIESPSGRPELAFPNAPYRVAALEWEPLRRGERPLGVPGEAEFIQPIREMADLQLIGDGDEVAPGVTAIVTPGHSAGHTTFVVTTSKGNRLIAFGDCFHTPAQLCHPDWTSAPDVDPAAVIGARQRILSELRTANSIGFAMHFGDQPFGKVTGGSEAVRWLPQPTEVLMAPPRSV